MNIKQAQQLSGVSADNIRFYEKEGLLYPSRNPDNDYRDYSDTDIHTLKLIRALRMLDMPLGQIKAVLDRSVSLPQAALEQRKRLEERSQQLSEAIRFCGEFASLPGLETLDLDALLLQMEKPERVEGFFRGWLNDYRRMALAEHEKRFTFLPDGTVTNPREFSDALLQYARDNDLDLVITKESMCPEFTINGVEYTAQRSYTVVCKCPVASIACQVAHPEDFEPQDIPPARRRVQKLFHILWLPTLLILLPFLSRRDLLSALFTSWEGWLVLVSILVLVGTLSLRGGLLFSNENGKKGQK